MSLEVACPSCEGKFRVPDSAAGKKIRCPKCKGAIEVPDGELEASPEPEPEPAPPPPEKKVEKKVEKKAEPAAKKVAAPIEQWFLKGDDGESYGPVSKSELDAWKKEGRVTADCQLLKEGTSQWQWAPDVYPDLEVPAEEEPAPEPEPEVPAKKSAPKATAKKAAAPVWEAPEEEEDEAEEEEEPLPVAKVAKTTAKRSKQAALDTDDEDEDKSSRSKAIAGLLGIFLGPVGAHRFYLGYWGLGIAMLLTAGGCGIWSLVDGIFILLGKITDADGRMLSD